jgi:hypothetical protein
MVSSSGPAATPIATHIVIPSRVFYRSRRCLLLRVLGSSRLLKTQSKTRYQADCKQIRRRLADCSPLSNGAFTKPPDIKTDFFSHIHFWLEGKFKTLRGSRPLERAGIVELEIEMTRKISAVIAAAALIVGASAASAQQPVRHVAHVAHHYQVPVQSAEGTNYHFRGDASGVRPQADPLVGTVFEGVAPY